MLKEQIFINNGELYKEVRDYEGPYEDPYITTYFEDPLFPFYKMVEGKRKNYKSTEEIRRFLKIESDKPVPDLSYFDLCPDITLWVGAAEIFDTNKKEVYFRVENSDVLKKVANYYNLPYPIHEEFEKVLNETPELISSYWDDNEEVVLASVKFEDQTPVMLKLYAIYKHEGKYDIMNRGRVFCDGKVIEQGGWYIGRNLPNKFESKGEGFKVEYVPDYKTLNDPIIHFKGIVTYDDGSTAVKYYESSKMVRRAIAYLATGNDYKEFNKCPDVTWWLGKSTLNNEEELFFHVESKEMLDKVCSYYNMPVPYDAALEQELIHRIGSVRYRSFDLLREGPGKFIEIILASVVFVDKVPTAIKFYETKRPNE